jgi:hypothetical protein
MYKRGFIINSWAEHICELIPEGNETVWTIICPFLAGFELYKSNPSNPVARYFSGPYRVHTDGLLNWLCNIAAEKTEPGMEYSLQTIGKNDLSYHVILRQGITTTQLSDALDIDREKVNDHLNSFLVFKQE